MNHLKLTKAIASTKLSNDLYTVLDSDDVRAECPFTGGCLVSAKAIIIANGEGSLVRIISDANGGQTEHYGALINGSIFDFDGPADTAEKWIERFRTQERINDRELSYAEGFDSESEIPDSAAASKAIAKLLTSAAK